MVYTFCMTRGGKRPGAGRPPGGGMYQGEPTTTIKVPEKFRDLIVKFILVALDMRKTEEWDNWLNSWQINKR